MPDCCRLSDVNGEVMKNSAFSLVLAACVTLGLGFVEAASNGQGREARPVANPTLCSDEAGRQYSRNAMRKVNGQIQRCDGGNRWLASSTDGTRDEKTANAAQGKKDCIGKHAEAYESGLFRQVEAQFERCEDGKWLPVQR